MSLEQERNNQRLAQELAAAEKSGADKALIKKKYDEIDKKIEKQKNAFKVDIASQTLGNVIAIAGKESDVGKAAAIAQTTIDTYKAATSAYSAMSGIPIVGPALIFCV